MDERMLARWHQELNLSCFDGVLPEPTFYIGLCRDPAVADGQYEALYYADYAGRGTIFINPDHAVDFKACVAHEMIHQWQDLCGLRLDHRAVFKAWAQHITEQTGLVP
jgi:hypothetical protein